MVASKQEDQQQQKLN